MSDNYVFRKRAAVLSAHVLHLDDVDSTPDKARRKLLAKHHKTLIKNVAKNHGRIVRLEGDDMLAVFVDARQATNCAIEFQKHAIARNKGAPAERIVQFRIGLGLGDIAVRADNIEGDAVAQATALQAAAPADGIWVTGDIPEDLRGRLQVAFSQVPLDEIGAADGADPIAPFSPHAVELDKQAPMRAADYMLPDGRGSIVSLIAPVLGMLLLVVIAWFWLSSK